MTNKQQEFLSTVKTEYGDISTITRSQVLELSKKYPNISKYPPKWLKANTVAKGEYALDVADVPANAIPVVSPEISGNAIKGEVIDTSAEIDTIIDFIH